MDTTKKTVCSVLPIILYVCFLTPVEVKECERNAGIFFLSQPQDHTACVGGSAMMNCNYNGTDSFPYWFINSMEYVSSDLPINTGYDGRTLTVNMLREDQNGTSYQCFFKVPDPPNPFCMVTSTIGRLTVLSPSICEQHEGPTNITKNEGEFNIFIPCHQFNLDLPVWKINGYYYELSQLPNFYKPDYGGIYIRVIKRELNGTTFQCYGTYINIIGYEHEKIVIASSIGVLTVNPTSNTPPIPVQNSRLYLDHDSILSYVGHNLTLAWKPILGLDCSTYEIMLRDGCELESVIERRLTVSSRLNTTFLHDNILSSYYITIENKNGESICQWMNMTFQFSENGTFNMEVPASLSKLRAGFILNEFSVFYLVLPREGDMQDCFCPVIFQFSEMESCFELEHCPCINHTKFIDSSLKLCSDALLNYNYYSYGIFLHIQNLRKDMNNSNIYIFQGYYCSNDVTFPIVREYIHSLKIIIVLPEPPTIFLYKDENRVCFESGPVDGISVDYYEVIVRDVTEEQLYNTTVHTPNNCTWILLQDKKCAPHFVSVQAFNPKGSSEKSVAVLNGSQDATEWEICSCYIAKLGVICSLDVEETLKVLCSAEWHADVDTYHIEIRVDNRLIERSSVIGSYTFGNDYFDCNKEYNVSVCLEVHDNLECSLLIRNNAHLSCQEHTNLTLSQLVVFIVSIFVVLTVLIVVVVLTSAIIVVCDRIRKKKYNIKWIRNFKLPTLFKLKFKTPSNMDTNDS